MLRRCPIIGLVLEFPEFTRRGWMRLALLVGLIFVEGLAGVWAAIQFAQPIQSGGSRIQFLWAPMVTGVSVLLVLVWNGEFSFFNCLKDRGPRKLSKIFLLAMIPVVTGFDANLIQSPDYLSFFADHFKSLKMDLFTLSVMGMGFLTQLCLLPTLFKTLGDRLNWLWFVGAVCFIELLPHMIGQVFVSLMQDKSGWENSIAFAMVSRMSIPLAFQTLVFAFTCLLMLLWSRGDIRSVMFVTVFGMLQRFFAPPFFSIIGVTGQLAGLFLLWLAVGGLKRLQRSRRMVAHDSSPGV